ncbi:electron transfer flavoprotein [Dietzia sp. UCD-THP]|nr:electron transfer flavoprotein [Dietzia sp. UCD-THP]
MMRVVVVGAGMSGARLAEELRRAEPDPETLSVTVLGDEPEAPYNRIMLSHVVAGGMGDPGATRLKPSGWWERNHIGVRTAASVQGVDRAAREVELADGERVPYDHLVLATGSEPTIPPIEGVRGPDGSLAPGVFPLRDASDCRGLTAHLEEHPGRVALVGGGFIGLEVACALARSGRDVVVVHPRAWPMDSHLDSGGGRVLIRALDELGVRVVTGARAARWDGSALGLDDGTEIDCRTVVLSAGTRPRTRLAAAAGLEVGRGIVVDDTMRTGDPDITAIGDCAEHRGCVTGLVGPAWDQAGVVAARITGATPAALYTGGVAVTRLKAFGVDVVSLGDLAEDIHDTAVEVTVVCEPSRGRYARVDVVDGRVAGAVLVGHPEPVGFLTQLYEHALPVPDDVLSVVLGRADASTTDTPSTMPAAAVVCRCNGVSKADLVHAWSEGHRDVAAIASHTRAGTGCGGCSAAVDGICGWLRDCA